MVTSASIVFGGAALGYGGRLSVLQTAAEALELLQKHGVTKIDTAQAYGNSEETLGKLNAASRFAIDTKYPGGLIPNDATTEVVVEGGKESLKKLNTDKVLR
jgi:aflatoxin B1 aldehyde reductase